MARDASSDSASSANRVIRQSPLIHIGFHKTATTWLQSNVFDHRGLGLGCIDTRRAAKDPLIDPHDFDFDAAACQTHYEPAIRHTTSQGLHPVLSHERFSGALHGGGRDSKAIADRLSAVFPDAHIFIVIREQRSMLRSAFGQYIKGNGVSSLGDYLKPSTANDAMAKAAGHRRDHLRYDRPIAHYQGLFGTDNVTVLPYEMLRREPSRFVGILLERAGHPAEQSIIDDLPFGSESNPSMSATGLAIKRRLNRLVGARTPLNTSPLLAMPNQRKRVQRLALMVDGRLPTAWTSASDARMSKRIETAVADFYSESNQRTAALTGLPLADYGYMMGSTDGRQG